MAPRHDVRHSGHGEAPGHADQRYLKASFGLIVAFMAVEVAVALVSHSLAVLADAGHMVTDAGALLGSIAAGRLAARPASGVWTYGLKRAEILAAAGNGVTLVVIAALVCFEAVLRLIRPVAVDGTALLVVAGVGVGVNLVATWLMAKADRSSLNVEGAFRHIVTDLFAFLGTLVAGVLIITTGFRRVDAIASLVVVALMASAAFGLLRDSGRILLEAAPDNVSLGTVRADLLEIPHVRDVHDLHIWTLTSNLPALSAHVVVEDCCFLENHAPRVLDDLQACLAGHFDVDHSTFQLEATGHIEHETGGHG